MALRSMIYLIIINLVNLYHSAESDLKKRRDKYQPISIIFEIGSGRPAKGKFRKLAFKLHSTIRFSIDDNVYIKTPCSKTIHTQFTKLASFCRLVSMNNNYMFSNSIPH